MGTHIEIDDAQLYGRACTIDAYWEGTRATVTVRMDGRDFTSEYALTTERARHLAQGQIALVTGGDMAMVRAHIHAVEMNGGRLPGPRIVLT